MKRNTISLLLIIAGTLVLSPLWRPTTFRCRSTIVSTTYWKADGSGASLMRTSSR